MERLIQYGRPIKTFNVFKLCYIPMLLGCNVILLFVTVSFLKAFPAIFRKKVPHFNPELNGGLGGPFQTDGNKLNAREHVLFGKGTTCVQERNQSQR